MILDLFDSGADGLCKREESKIGSRRSRKTAIKLTSIANRIFFWFSICSGPSCLTRTILAKTGSDLARMKRAVSSRFVSAREDRESAPQCRGKARRELTLQHQTLQLCRLPLLLLSLLDQLAHARLDLLRRLPQPTQVAKGPVLVVVVDRLAALGRLVRLSDVLDERLDDGRVLAELLQGRVNGPSRRQGAGRRQLTISKSFSTLKYAFKNSPAMPVSCT